jgi:hypothetical protein
MTCIPPNRDLFGRIFFLGELNYSPDELPDADLLHRAFTMLIVIFPHVTRCWKAQGTCVELDLETAQQTFL